MARTAFNDVVLRVDSVTETAYALSNIRVHVYLRGTVTYATIYTAATGATQQVNPFTTSLGKISFWADTGAYDIRLEDTVTPARVSPYTIPWDSLPAVTGGIPPELLAAGIAEAKLILTPGDLKATARSTAPTGWLMCNGAAVSRTTYADLFAAIGTVYGAGDGTTTFNLPDLRDRAPIGASSTIVRGAAGGEKTTTLTTTQLPAHNHVASQPAHSHGVTDNGHDHGYRLFDNPGAGVLAQGGSGAAYTPTGDGVLPATTGISINLAGGEAVTVNNTGGGGSHNNMPPYQAVNWLVKT